MAGKPSMTGVALIIGAASGIDKVTGLSFAEAGAGRIVMADINRNAAEVALQCNKIAKHPGSLSLAAHVDVVDENSLEDSDESG
ncbi:MAG: hypothetical protein Q9166_008039 [cf. Caloplaca sp. 2 TL-2023]